MSTNTRAKAAEPPVAALQPIRNRWMAAAAAVASLAICTPLILNGAPDVESYAMSIFSTVAFARNLRVGVDPWFVPAYGFGIPLPSSTWLIKFPTAIPAAFGGPDALYAAVWLTGEFLFGSTFSSWRRL